MTILGLDPGFAQELVRLERNTALVGAPVGLGNPPRLCTVQQHHALGLSSPLPRRPMYGTKYYVRGVRSQCEHHFDAAKPWSRVLRIAANSVLA